MRPRPSHNAVLQGYPIRSHSFVYSLGVHGVVVVLLLMAPRLQSPPDISVREQIMELESRKIVYYDLRKVLPDVKPVEKVGDSILPRGTVVSKRAIIATAPKPVSRTQSVYVAAPKIELQKDIPVPDLVARTATSLPTLAPPPKPVRAPPKSFVPPPINRQPKLAVQVPTVDTSAPAVNSPTTPTPPSVINGMSSLSRIAEPRPEAPPVPATASGNANVDVVVANLDPAKNTSAAIPEGERAGQFSKAPIQGPAASGAATPATLTVPNLSMRDSAVKPVRVPVPEEKPATKAILYTEKVRNAPQSTLSVPLRSASRSIPAEVEARFRGRSVYAIVIPIENMPIYTGDWIVWFAELTPKAGETPLMYAPMPLRKFEVIEQAPASNRLKQRIQVAANLGADGKLNHVAPVTNVAPAVEQSAIQDLSAWEFKPATRNGTPVAVEIVIEIPFNLPLSSAPNSLP